MRVRGSRAVESISDDRTRSRAREREHKGSIHKTVALAENRSTRDGREWCGVRSARSWRREITGARAKRNAGVLRGKRERADGRSVRPREREIFAIRREAEISVEFLPRRTPVFRRSKNDEVAAGWDMYGRESPLLWQSIIIR